MDVCSKVFQCPPIMEIIFKFLSVKDLNSCAKVCILWRSMSLTEKNKRRFVEWFLEVFEEQGNPVTRSFQKMKAPMKRKTTKKKVEIGESVDMDGNRIAAAPQAGKLYPFQEKLAAVRAQPNFCLAFVTADTLKHIDKVFSCLESTVAPMKKLPKQHSNTYDMKVMDDEIIRSGLKAKMDVEGRIFQCPLIMEHILKFLNAKDLSSCAKVCTLWHSMSLSENNRRRFVEWFLEVGIGQSVDMDGNRVTTGHPAGKLYPFQEKLAAVRAQPNFCLAFVTADTLEHIGEAFSCFESNAAPKKKVRMQHYERFASRLKAIGDRFLNPLLPVQCKLHCIASPGIIGCHYNLSPAEVEEGYAISGLLLPDFPGVTVHHCPIEQVGQWKVSSRTFPNVPIKCLLMFASMPSLRLIQTFINQCVKYNDSEFAVGGAIVEPLSNSLGSCFAFAGENLEAASIVIDQTTTDVAYELGLFKKTGMLVNHCFALMFSCVDKGIRKYSVPNYESSIFRSLYPDVPLSGVFGNGEIGMHFLPNVDKEDPDHKQRSKKFPCKNCVRAYNTIFVLLSVKTPK